MLLGVFQFGPSRLTDISVNIQNEYFVGQVNFSLVKFVEPFRYTGAKCLRSVMLCVFTNTNRKDNLAGQGFAPANLKEGIHKSCGATETNDGRSAGLWLVSHGLSPFQRKLRIAQGKKLLAL